MTSSSLAPRVRLETIDIRTSDGWSLRADVREPPSTPVGVIVLAHAMMARRSEFDRPRDAGLAELFAARGWLAVTFDFRGHGDSGPAPDQGGRYRYDDLVTQDLPAVCAFAREQAGRRKAVVVLGHSLGGHVSLVAQGTGAIRADAMIGVGASPWVPAFEPSRVRWLAKRTLMEGFRALSRRVGHFPARTLRIGSDDISRGCVADFTRFARTGVWASRDGKVDYMAALGRVEVPVLQVVSEGDRLECPPACGERFAARCPGLADVVRVTRADDGGPPPDHMGLVTSGRVGTVWERVEGWARRHADELTLAAPPTKRSLT
jgi:predicted alpha/beta hydrolase